jgi:hypothetical protein
MAFDLADIVPLTVNIRDSAGALADAGAVTLTIGEPDGTTVTPAVTHSGTGVYQVDYAPTMPGRHTVTWVATGVNSCGFSDVFDVRAAAPPYLVSLADVKEQLNKIATIDDEELRRLVEAATAAVERHLDKAVVRRTVVEKRDLGIPNTHAAPGILQSFVLSTKPVLSLTSVVAADGGLTWSPANMSVTEGGVVRVLAGSVVWGPVTFTYEAGMTLIPAEYGKAAEIIVQHIWQDTQRGQKGSPRAGLDTPGAGFTSFAYSIPNKALELLGPTISGIA